MEQILRRSITTNLVSLKKNNLSIYDIIYSQFISLLNSFWNNYNIQNIQLHCIFITYIECQADLHTIKELYETNKLNLCVDENKHFITGTNLLVIGLIILHHKTDYFCFKYNLKINYIDRIQSLFMCVGIASKMIKRVENIKKKKLLPLVIITHSVEFWFKFLKKNIAFTTSKKLKQIVRELSLSSAIEWNYLFNNLDMKCKIIINQVASNFVKNVLTKKHQTKCI